MAEAAAKYGPLREFVVTVVANGVVGGVELVGFLEVVHTCVHVAFEEGDTAEAELPPEHILGLGLETGLDPGPAPGSTGSTDEGGPAQTEDPFGGDTDVVGMEAVSSGGGSEAGGLVDLLQPG